ncbi:DUF4097 family beta strand repeat-containing protein [Acidobacteriota bacterium]
MRTNFRCVFGLIIIGLLSSSCVIAVLDYPDSGSNYKAEEFHRVLPFEEEGELSLVNIHGIIEIIGQDSDELEISAEKILPRPYSRRIRVYSRSDFLPDIDVERYNNSINIQTDHRGGSDYSPQVNYFLNVPRHIHLRSIRQDSGDILVSSIFGSADIDMDEGNVIVENFSGSLTVEVRNGDIELSLFDLREEDDIRITCGTGNISVSLERDVSASIVAEAPEGEIFNEFEGDQDAFSGRETFTLRDGGARIVLEVQEGDIRITKNSEQ